MGSLNEYRRSILSKLRERFNITVLERTFGDELRNYISRAKLVINIHYYSEALLERARLHEIIPFGVPIISERPIKEQIYLEEYYSNYVTFVDDILESDDLINYHISNTKSEEYLNAEYLNSDFNNFVSYIRYPNLFNKYLLEIERNDKEIEYEIVRQNSGKYLERIAHLHCFDMGKFEEIYGKYLDNISKNFTIIITYSEGEIGDIEEEYTILKIPNKGMDIGAKFCAIDYLNKSGIDYNHLLFLHSKTNVNAREMYFEFLDDDHIDLTLQNMRENYDGIFPNLKRNGDWMTGKWYPNKIYTEELLNYLNVSSERKEFFEGNCMILSKRIVDKIFSNNLKNLYNILNTRETFDLNWVRWYYKPNTNNIREIYNAYSKNKLIGNDLGNPFTQLISDNTSAKTAFNEPFEGKKFADAMVEHAFERIYLNVIDSFENGKYYFKESRRRKIRI